MKKTLFIFKFSELIFFAITIKNGFLDFYRSLSSDMMLGNSPILR